MAQPADSQRFGSAAIPSHADTPGDAPGSPTRVEAALGRLADLDRVPLSAHPDVYQRIHAELQGALAEIDDA